MIEAKFRSQLLKLPQPEPFYIQGVSLKMNPKCDEMGSFLGEIWSFLRFYRELAEKMNPILAKRPSKLRKEWNFAKFKQLLGKHQNKIEEKMNPIQKWL